MNRLRNRPEQDQSDLLRQPYDESSITTANKTNDTGYWFCLISFHRAHLDERELASISAALLGIYVFAPVRHTRGIASIPGHLDYWLSNHIC